MKMPKMEIRKAEIEKLYELLLGLAQGLERLYQCLRSQQAALISWNFEDFISTVQEQKRLARENLSREEERKALLSQMTGLRQEISLRELTGLLEDPWQKRFSELAERLKAESGKVIQMKKQNEFLINKSRELVNEQLKLLLDLARLNRNLYEKSGKKSKKTNLHKVLDQKV